MCGGEGVCVGGRGVCSLVYVNVCIGGHLIFVCDLL